MALTPGELDERIKTVQTRFDQAQADKERIDAELFRLQGEYRVLTEMKEQASDPALVARAEPAQSAQGYTVDGRHATKEQYEKAVAKKAEAKSAA